MVDTTSKLAHNKITQIEKKLFQKINLFRENNRKSKLKINAKITNLAREHSKAMAMNNIPFGHDGLKVRLKIIESFLPHNNVAENVASYTGHPLNEDIVIQFWLKSDKHRKKILGDYQITGIGIASNLNDIYFVTQIFVKRIDKIVDLAV